MQEFFSTFNSAWSAIAGVVFLVIWVYRIRIDTTINTSKIKDLAEDLDRSETSIRSEISKLREEVQDQLRSYQSEQKERMEAISEQIEKLTEAITELKIEISRHSTNILNG